MAARSVLLESEILEGQAILLNDLAFPARAAENRKKFSHWLEERLIEKLKAIGDFSVLDPVYLGSWSRNELCPRSDIDLLFLGPEEKVHEFVREAFSSGLKLRSRTPEDTADWSVGVEPFDVLALQTAQALTSHGQAELNTQRPLVKRFRRKIFSAIRREREMRRKRQDSVSSFLEPNLKFGAGGLRDIEQALSLPDLFPEVFADQDLYAFQALRDIKDELLFLRALLHLQGSGDIFTAQDQYTFVKLLKMESHTALMKIVQSELERASFYADWAIEYVHLGFKKQNVRRLTTKITDLHEGLKKLKADPGLMTQFAVRRKVEDLNRGLTPADTGRVIQKVLFGDCDDQFLVALHRTRILEVWIPDLKKIRGLVQHDHYHRFTVDAHLVQTLREVERIRKKPSAYGRMGRLGKKLTAQDWWILKLTALFHDLAKGRKGDHSTEGAALVRQYFAKWGYPENITADVEWLVANHLLLSTAAFRQNPNAKSTWQRLFDRGVEGRRLKLLALFTAVDIRSTNPEAWTDWKSQLLFDLVQSMTSNEARQFQSHMAVARKLDIPRAGEWILAMDPAVLESLPPKLLLEDLVDAEKSDDDLAVKVFASKKQKRVTWIRFHKKIDETGVFLNFVKRLYGFGLNVQIASVHTLAKVGVYDWFCVRTDKPAKQLSEWLNRAAITPSVTPKVCFQSIDLMTQDQDEWILSFRGKDQRGLLVAAADALAAEYLSLRWARVHTWGGQVDDIFGVQPLGEAEIVLERLKQKFVT